MDERAFMIARQSNANDTLLNREEEEEKKILAKWHFSRSANDRQQLANVDDATLHIFL